MEAEGRDAKANPRLYAFDRHSELYLPPDRMDGLGHRAYLSGNVPVSSSSSSNGRSRVLAAVPPPEDAQEPPRSHAQTQPHRRLASQPPLSRQASASPRITVHPGDGRDQDGVAESDGSGRSPASGQQQERRLSLPLHRRRHELTPVLPDGEDVYQLISSDGLPLTAPADIQELVRSQLLAQARQERINQSHSRMQSLNLMMSAASLAKTTELQQQHAVFKQDIAQGRQWLESLQRQVIRQEDNYMVLGRDVSLLGEAVQRQSERMSELDSEVAAQGRRMEEALEEYNERLNRQAEQLRVQQSMISRVLSVRFKLDFAIDIAVVLAAWWLSEARPVNFAARTLAGWIPGVGWLGRLFGGAAGGSVVAQAPAVAAAAAAAGLGGAGVVRRLAAVEHRHQLSAGRTLATQFLKLVFCWQVVSRLRGLLQAQGLHSSVGGLGEYLQVARGSALLGLLHGWHHLRRKAGARAARLLQQQQQQQQQQPQPQQQPPQFQLAEIPVAGTPSAAEEQPRS